MLVLRFDHQVGDHCGGWVYDYSAYLAAGAVGTSRVGPDHVRRQICHPALTSPVDLLHLCPAAGASNRDRTC